MEELLQTEFQQLNKLIKTVNSILMPLRQNLYNYLNDKHNNKLNSSIDLITQDDGIRFQEQKVFELFKRILYYCENIQHDIMDEFWLKIKKIKDIDFSLLDEQRKSVIYKNIFHLILEYELRIFEQQKLLHKQKEQANRIKRIQKIKDEQNKRKEEKQLKKEKQQQEKQQQLIQDYNKIINVLEIQFEKMINKTEKIKKAPYAISKNRKIEKIKKQYNTTQQSSHQTHKTGISKPRKPKKTRTGRKY